MPGFDAQNKVALGALKVCFISISLFSSPPAPSPVSSIQATDVTRHSLSLAWQQPDRPNGVILEYEVKFYEKVSWLRGMSAQQHSVLCFGR